MKKVLLLFSLLFLAFFASGHSGQGVTPHADEELCGAPVPAEYTLTTPIAVGLAAAFIAGLALLACAALGMAFTKPNKTAFLAAGILLCAASAGYYLFASPGYNPAVGSFGTSILN